MAKIKLTIEEIKSVLKELQEAGSKQQFLINKKAIKVDDKGVWSVCYYEGLSLDMKEAMPNRAYTTDFPYQFWQEVLRQVDYYVYLKEQKAKKQAEAVK